MSCKQKKDFLLTTRSFPLSEQLTTELFCLQLCLGAFSLPLEIVLLTDGAVQAFFTLPALQKNFVTIFFVFAWEFCIEKWRGFFW